MTQNEMPSANDRLAPDSNAQPGNEPASLVDHVPESKGSKRAAKAKVDPDLVLRLRARGLSWEQVAREVGHANKSSVYRLAAKALAQVHVEEVGEVRKPASMKFDRLKRRLTAYRLAAKALAQIPVETIGEVRELESMKLDRLEHRLAAYIDPPTTDEAKSEWTPERQLEAVLVAVRVSERRAKLLGLDAPTIKVLIGRTLNDGDICELTVEAAYTSPNREVTNE